MIDKRVLVQHSYDILGELSNKLGESVAIAILHPDTAEVEAVARYEGKGVSVRIEQGIRSSVHIAAPGKAILACLPTEERQNIIDRIKFIRYTDTTITDADAFFAELDKARSCGFAVDNSEANEGVNCVAVPVFDGSGQAVAGLWTSSFPNRLNESNFDQTAKVLQRSADELKRLLDTGENDSKHAQSIIEECRKYMSDNFRQKIDLEQLAEKHKVKYSWFRTRFKKFTGLSPKQYILQLRMDTAMELLENTDMPIKEIALSLGYDSQNYFSSAFHKRFGRYPSDARK